MDMIEVDPKLFVTCRLCLEDMGHYQIVPIVQQQIKYCFGIEVQPFDGLPQLICSKCKEILTNFHTLKTSFCEKQDKLKINMSKKEINEICIQPQQNTVSSSQLAPDNTDKNARPKSRVRRRIDSSESESLSNIVKYNKKNKTKLGTKWNWTGYKRTCVCLLCKSEWQNFKSYRSHRHLHGNMKKKYAQMFKKTCLVVLNKIDNKPNITGQNNIVVHNPNQIIEHHNSLYYFKYTKNSNDGNSSDSATTYHSYKASKLVDPESTDTETEMTTAKPKRRKRQALSRSSNDTVVIESNANKIGAEDEDDIKSIVKDCNNTQNEQNEIEQCISIEDSDSDKDTLEFVQKTRQPFEARLGDFKIIQGIITTCVNAYHRKKETTEKLSDKPTSSESQLKHKVLSIGRKIINRPGFNWTGLLRYLERKNLDIEWATKALSSSNSKESNYIRVMTKLRGLETSDYNLGWEPVTPRPVASVEMPDTTLSISRSMPSVIQISNNAQPPIDSAILFICSPPDPKNKLLNANPVPNPKQLPRKLAQPSESRINKPIAEPSAIFQNNEENDSSMPIITSTTSLAVTAVEDQTNAPPATTSSVEASAPRIKVKPVTELMSERILNSLRNDQRSESTNNMLLNQSENIKEPALNPPNQNTNNIVLNQTTWATHSVPNVYMSNIVPQFSTAGQPIQLVPLTTFNVTPTQTYPALLPKPTPTTTKDANRQYNDSVTQACDSYGVMWHQPAYFKDVPSRVYL